jgi:hypothetical protein
VHQGRPDARRPHSLTGACVLMQSRCGGPRRGGSLEAQLAAASDAVLALLTQSWRGGPRRNGPRPGSHPRRRGRSGAVTPPCRRRRWAAGPRIDSTHTRGCASTERTMSRCAAAHVAPARPSTRGSTRGPGAAHRLMASAPGYATAWGACGGRRLGVPYPPCASPPAPHPQVDYVCEILDGGARPAFRITPSDDPASPEVLPPPNTHTQGHTLSPRSAPLQRLGRPSGGAQTLQRCRPRAQAPPPGTRSCTYTCTPALCARRWLPSRQRRSSSCSLEGPPCLPSTQRDAQRDSPRAAREGPQEGPRGGRRRACHEAGGQCRAGQ